MSAGIAGSRLNQYKIIRRIAAGGMAEIYLASHAKMEGCEKLVVIKKILPSLASDIEYTKMLLNEARLIAQLSHPNIISFLDIESRNGQFIIFMEFLFGRDLLAILKKACERDCFIPLGAAVSTILGVCAGLHYAHEKTGRSGESLGIIHRDISPQNIFVTFDGCVKVIDFGIAKVTQDMTQTRPGTVKGKFSYLSPEQARGGALDRRSDIFSLCIVLWELTTRIKLFKGTNEYEVMKAVFDASIPAPSRVAPNYPPALEHIVMKGLRRAPEERWQTAEELQLAIEGFTRDQGITVSPLSVSSLMRDFFPGESGSNDRALWNPDADLSADFFASLPGSLGTRRDDDSMDWESSKRPSWQHSSLGATAPDLITRGRRRLPQTARTVGLGISTAALLAIGVARCPSGTGAQPSAMGRAPPVARALPSASTGPAITPPLVVQSPVVPPPRSLLSKTERKRAPRVKQLAPKPDADLVDLIDDDEPLAH